MKEPGFRGSLDERGQKMLGRLVKLQESVNGTLGYSQLNQLVMYKCYKSQLLCMMTISDPRGMNAMLGFVYAKHRRDMRRADAWMDVRL